MPDFTMKPTFPIADVVQAAQRKAQIEQSSKTAANQQLVEGLQGIGQIGQSLVDKRLKVAQALALGRQFGVPDDQAKLMDPDQVLKIAAINKGGVDMNMLFSLLHPAAGAAQAGGAMPASQPPAPAPASPGNGMMLTGGLGAPQPIPQTPPAPMPDGGVNPSTATTPAPAVMPTPSAVPMQAPPLKPKMVNPATAHMAFTMAMANKPESVYSYDNKGGLTPIGQVPKGSRIEKDPNQLTVGNKEDQFYQREWDKLLKETDPLNASSRTPLGLASRASFQANRALKTLSNPVVTNQEAGNAMADIAAIYQNGSPTQFGMSHQEYQTFYGKVQGVIQSISGKPQDALPDAIKSRLVGVLTDMKSTNSAILHQRLDMTEHTKKAVISRFPEEWKEYRQILEGDQTDYNGLGAQQPQGSSATAAPDASSTWDNTKEQRLQMLLDKQAKGSLKS